MSKTSKAKVIKNAGYGDFADLKVPYLLLDVDGVRCFFNLVPWGKGWQSTSGGVPQDVAEVADEAVHDFCRGYSKK